MSEKNEKGLASDKVLLRLSGGLSKHGSFWQWLLQNCLLQCQHSLNLQFCFDSKPQFIVGLEFLGTVSPKSTGSCLSASCTKLPFTWTKVNSEYETAVIYPSFSSPFPPSLDLKVKSSTGEYITFLQYLLFVLKHKKPSPKQLEFIKEETFWKTFLPVFIGLPRMLQVQ